VAYWSHTPVAPLWRYVASLWLSEGHTQPHAKERVLPSGEMQLVINLQEDRLRVYDRENTAYCDTFRGALVTGARSEYSVIDTAQQAYIMGVQFRPGGGFPFFRLPAGELAHTQAPLDALWASDADGLRCQLLEAATHQERFAILERRLLSELARGREPNGAVSFALRQFVARPHAASIAEVTGQTGLSTKRFIQAFRDEVGLTPKVFCRIRRFQQALRRIQHRGKVDWAAVALDAGYFDQAHFIHDFRAFSGISPSAYVARRSPYQNHVPLAD